MRVTELFHTSSKPCLSSVTAVVCWNGKIQNGSTYGTYPSASMAHAGEEAGGACAERNDGPVRVSVGLEIVEVVLISTRRWIDSKGV